MSIANDIADAVVTKIGTLSLTGATIVSRKQPGFRKGDSDPLITVSVVEDGEEPFSGEAGDAREVDYTVTVTITSKNADDGILAPNETLQDWRESIRHALDVGYLTSVSAVVDTSYTGGSLNSNRALDMQYVYSAMTFRFTALEAR